MVDARARSATPASRRNAPPSGGSTLPSTPPVRRRPAAPRATGFASLGLSKSGETASLPRPTTSQHPPRPTTTSSMSRRAFTPTHSSTENSSMEASIGKGALQAMLKGPPARGPRSPRGHRLVASAGARRAAAAGGERSPRSPKGTTSPRSRPLPAELQPVPQINQEVATDAMRRLDLLLANDGRDVGRRGSSAPARRRGSIGPVPYGVPYRSGERSVVQSMANIDHAHRKLGVLRGVVDDICEGVDPSDDVLGVHTEVRDFEMMALAAAGQGMTIKGFQSNTKEIDDVLYCPNEEPNITRKEETAEETIARVRGWLAKRNQCFGARDAYDNLVKKLEQGNFGANDGSAKENEMRAAYKWAVNDLAENGAGADTRENSALSRFLKTQEEHRREISMRLEMAKDVGEVKKLVWELTNLIQEKDEAIFHGFQHTEHLTNQVRELLRELRRIRENRNFGDLRPLRNELEFLLKDKEWTEERIVSYEALCLNESAGVGIDQ